MFEVSEEKHLRYTYFILPGQMGRDGRDIILRISASKRKIINKLVYLFGHQSICSSTEQLHCI